ncbi:MAG: S9 family peptidase [Acidobacteriota bacterium]
MIYCRSRQTLVLAIMIFLLATNVWAAKRPVTGEDSVMLKRPQDAQISPDGKWVSFHYSEPKLKTAPRNSDIWIVSTTGGEPRKLTNAPKQDGRARWSPDGKWLAFLSDRDDSGKTQIFLIRIDGGEAIALTNQKASVSAHSWSPDGKRIAFLMTDPPSPEEEQRLRDRDDTQMFDDNFKYQRLYTVEVASGKVVQVTNMAANVWEYDWSPDGSKFVIAVSDTPRIDESYVRVRLETISSTGGPSTKLVSPSGKFPGKMRVPCWSPNGETIAYLASGAEGREPYAGCIWVVPSSGGQPKNLTERFTGTFTELNWLPNNQILGLAIESVHHSLQLVSPSNGEMKPLLAASEGAVLRPELSISADGKQLVMIKQDAKRPDDVWIKNIGNNSLTQVTRLNPNSEEWEWGSTEVVRWKARDGLEIEGILVKPLNYQTGQRYPLLVHVHGGPEAAELNGFHLGYSDWGYLMSARGYAVLMPNYRGSIGRGVSFGMADQGDMGGKEFTDIMDGIDMLIQRGIVDGNRMGISGWSYGGYMTAWAVTQTDRFKLGIMGAGIANWVSFMSQTDIPYENAEAHWGDALFKDSKIYADRSPVEHVAKARTPVLILHGAADPRVPLAQGQEFYARLRFQGVTTSLAIYPREGHGLGEAAHQLDAIRRMNEWVDKYLK